MLRATWTASAQGVARLKFGKHKKRRARCNSMTKHWSGGHQPLSGVPPRVVDEGFKVLTAQLAEYFTVHGHDRQVPLLVTIIVDRDQTSLVST